MEVQVLADAHGAVVHLGERECSVQRRHQKLIEESPSPAVSEALRASMGEAALRLVRAAGYQGAGTVEFLLDGGGAFFFLEVNARLQVEHPVTEAVTGLDLVEQQLRVAAGEPLGFAQADVRLDGHAMELRIVAEDPLAGFLPSTGVVTALDLPGGVRVDTGIEAGSTISPFYDSLLAKVIAHRPDRAATIDALVDALDATRIEGVETNVDLLAAVLDEPAFRAGDLHTGFLDEHAVADRLAAVPDEVIVAAAASRSLAAPARGRAAPRLIRGGPPSRGGPGGSPSPCAGWPAAGRRRRGRRSTRAAPVRWSTSTGGRRVPSAPVGIARPAGPSRSATRPRSSARPSAPVASRRSTWLGRRHRISPAPPPDASPPAASADGPDALAAPMPGRIVRIHVAEGDRVRPNAPLVILEAMKMEHVIAASGAGRVARLHVAVGDQVVRGAPLVDLDDEAPA